MKMVQLELGRAWGCSCSIPFRRFGLISLSPIKTTTTTSISGSSSISISFAAAAATPAGAGFSLPKRCQKCGGKGAIDCPGCKGTGKNKKNGNIFERWKCFDCQGFGLKSCPECGSRGLTPEQRGER